MALLALLAAGAGLMALCLAMPRHRRQLRLAPPRRAAQQRLRWTGAAAIVLSLLFCSLAWGWSIGPVAWLGLLTLAGLGLVFLLPVVEQRSLRS